jgi:hypothetical protein
MQALAIWQLQPTKQLQGMSRLSGHLQARAKRIHKQQDDLFVSDTLLGATTASSPEFH